MEIAEHGLQWETVFLSERNDKTIVRGRGLQLKVERDTESFTERQPPGLVDPPAERRVEH